VSKNELIQLAVIVTLYLNIIIVSNSQSFGEKGGIEQIASQASDYPGANPKVI
jgi:hypothetical protein